MKIAQAVQVLTRLMREVEEADPAMAGHIASILEHASHPDVIGAHTSADNPEFALAVTRFLLSERPQLIQELMDESELAEWMGIIEEREEMEIEADSEANASPSFAVGGDEAEDRLSAYTNESGFIDLFAAMIDVIGVLKANGRTKEEFFAKAGKLWDDIAVHAGPKPKPVAAEGNNSIN